VGIADGIQLLLLTHKFFPCRKCRSLTIPLMRFPFHNGNSATPLPAAGGGGPKITIVSELDLP
jgi:hypothetical protein